MLAIDQAKQMYAASGLNLALDIGRHLDGGGVVHVAPAGVLLARPIRREDPDVWPADAAADAWYVTLAIGRGELPLFATLMPYFLPWVAWRRSFRRDQRLRVFPTTRVLNLNRNQSHG